MKRIKYCKYGYLIGILFCKFMFIRRKRKMGIDLSFLKKKDVVGDVINNEIEAVVECPKPKESMTAAEITALEDSIRAMDDEELEVVVGNIPIHFVLRRLEMELNRYKKFANSVQKAVDNL